MVAGRAALLRASTNHSERRNSRACQSGSGMGAGALGAPLRSTAHPWLARPQTSSLQPEAVWQVERPASGR